VGHIALLSKAFELGDFVIIGLSSDEFAVNRGKKISATFDERKMILERVIKERFGNVNYKILKLDGDFGPEVKNGRVDALVTSTETSSKSEKLNQLRMQSVLGPVEVIAVDLVKAQDNRPVSSTRIRSGEIDSEGRLLGKD
jgi:pantetheine-phosphate adenylyltransferase